MRIALDAMGGDHGVSTTVPSAIRFLNKNLDVEIILVGDSNVIHNELAKHNSSAIKSRIEVVHATEVVAMDALPQVAMRVRDSSMRIAINQVKEKKAHAIISAGNTGAEDPPGITAFNFLLFFMPPANSNSALNVVPSGTS